MDIFDTLQTEPNPDIFDKVAPVAPKADFSKLAGGAEAKISRPPGFLQTLIDEAVGPIKGMMRGELETAGEVAMGALGAVSAPFTAIQRKVAQGAQEYLGVSPGKAEAMGDFASAVTGMVPIPGGPIARLAKRAVKGAPVKPAAAAPVRDVFDDLVPEPKAAALPAPETVYGEGFTMQPAKQVEAPAPVVEAPKVNIPAPAVEAPKIDPIQEKIAVLERENALLRENRALREKPAPTVAPQSTISPQPIPEAQPIAQVPSVVKAPRQVLEDSEVAVSTFIQRQGGMRIPKELKEEFGGWNRLHNKSGLAADEMAGAAFDAGIIPEPTTNALIDGLKSGRKSARAGTSTKAIVEAEAERKIADIVDTPAELEFKGKTYEGAVREGNNVRLKDAPDKVLTKADDILKVEERIPFDVPGEAPMFERTAAGQQSVIPGAEARSIPKGGLRPKRKQAEALTDLERATLPDDQPSLIATPTKEAPEMAARGPLEILKGEKGEVRLGPLRMREGKPTQAPTKREVEDAVADLTVGSPRLTAGGILEESSKTLSKTMGPEGTELARLAKAVRNDAEIEAGTARQRVGSLVNKLDAKQADNLVDVLEGKAKPMDALVGRAFTTAREELDKVAARASKVGLQVKDPITGEKTPFQARENYFPHMFGKELGEVIKDPRAKANVKEQLKKQMEAGGKEVTDKQVETALQQMMKATRGREGHLEIARVFDAPDYSRDPKRVLSKHFQDAYRRINIAEKFGPDLNKGEELLTAIGQMKGDEAESFARTYFQRVTNTEPAGNLTAKKAADFARSYNAFSKLGQAVISNVSQPAYTAVVAGAKNAAKGYAKALTKEGRAFAERTGAVILDDAGRDFMNGTVMGKAAEQVLGKTGFLAVERMNRTVAANAGRYFAQETLEKLAKNPNNKRLRETLEKMNVDVDGALKRGSLSELDELRAGQNIANRTQFKTDVTELPLFWSSNAGRLVTQFKTFQFKSGQLIKDEIIKETLKGNVKPFIRAAAILPIAGYATVSAKDAIRFGQQTEKERGLADYLAAVGTFGAFTDAFAGSGRQPVKGLSYLAGPTLGEAGAAFEAGTAITREGDLRPMAKFLVKQVPVAGPSLRNIFNKPKKESEETKLMKELGLKKETQSNKKLMKELGLQP